MRIPLCSGLRQCRAHQAFTVIYAYAGRDASEAYSDIHEPNLIKKTLQPSELLGDLDPDTTFPDVVASRERREKGEKPPLAKLINLFDFEDAARQSISKKSFAFISGASNDNITRDANQDLFRKIWFRPRILKNVSKVSTKGTMLGCSVSLPVWIAPAGLATAGGPDGELALSRGAAATGIIQTVRRP